MLINQTCAAVGQGTNGGMWRAMTTKEVEKLFLALILHAKVLLIEKQTEFYSGEIFLEFVNEEFSQHKFTKLSRQIIMIDNELGKFPGRDDKKTKLIVDYVELKTEIVKVQ